MAKELLPHELKLIAQFLDMASEKFSRNVCNDFALDDTPRMRDLIRKMHIANNPATPESEIQDSLHVYNGSLNMPDWWLMSYFGDRVREALTEEES